MTLIRSYLFAGAFVLWSIFIALLLLPVAIVSADWLARGLRLWTDGSKLLLRAICGIKVEIRGREFAPQGAALVAAKHQCTFDALAPISLLARPCIVAKQELAQIPLYGWYTLRAGVAMTIDREGQSKALRDLLAKGRAILDQGRQLVIFPEGTRSAIGAPPDYKPGIAALYGQLNAPCAPIATNAGVHWLTGSAMRTPGTIVFEFLPPIPPGLKRAEFMRELERSIETACARLIEEGL